ncbi:hypothetical protein ScPMuIL_005857 [Solemya velum]
MSEDLAELQTKLNFQVQFAKQNRYKISETKTKVMIVNSAHVWNENESFMLDWNVLEVVIKRPTLRVTLGRDVEESVSRPTEKKVVKKMSEQKDHHEGSKLWGGRFTGATDPIMEKFNASISYDKRMWKADIEGSLAYVKATQKVGLVTDAEKEDITEGLQKIYKEWENGEFEIKTGDEDIHTANERRLKELIGTSAGKLHTGRSRNDQVNTDMRLWLRDAISTLRSYIKNFVKVLINRAKM